MSPSRIAMVTGAGSGIGRAAALALLAGGYGVVLVGRSAATLEETVRRAGEAGSRALAAPGDVTEPASVRAVFAACEARFGRLDVLFNNAGVNPSGGLPLDEVSYEDWQVTLSANVTGMFLCTQAAFALMKRQRPHGGRIINNGSIAAYAPRPNGIAYSASKHAVSGITKSTALEGRAFDIACSQIDIGNAGTEMTRPMAAGALQPDGRILAEAVFDVAHVGDAIRYMADLPLNVNVQFMTLMETKMPYLGRG